MNCKEFQERISAAVDSRLRRQERVEFEDHARRCTVCKGEYESERSTKALLLRRVRMVHVPADLQVSLTRMLAREAGDGWRPQNRPRRFAHAPLSRAVLAVSLTALLLGVILTGRRDVPDAPPVVSAGLGANNVIRQSVDDYHKILRGELTPQLSSAGTVDLQDFFTGKTSFPVLVPRMKECTLIGGVLQEHNGMRLPHVVYRAGDDVISVYQACWETVQEGKALDLAPEAKAAILTDSWYTPNPAGHDAVVLWRRDRTLCVAVSHMGLERLIASVRSGADSTLP